MAKYATWAMIEIAVKRGSRDLRNAPSRCPASMTSHSRRKAPAAVLVIVGGALYSVGALAYAAAWPNPLPAAFGFHEVFHILVIAAAATQFVALSLVVL